MSGFKLRGGARPDGGRLARAEIGELLERFLLRWKRRLADWLNARLARVEPERLLFILFAVFGGVAGYLLWLAVRLFY